MHSKNFALKLEKKLNFKPTQSQLQWFEEISKFILSKDLNSVFVLKGYAGSGKTTLLGSLVNELNTINYKAVMMAPTGRAAKVMSAYSNYPAYTIHKQIYNTKSEEKGSVVFDLKKNTHKNTIFIVDEASMIGSESTQTNFSKNNSLLNDLVNYIKNGYNCKLIFVGDPAQLPPINLTLSPALDLDLLEEYYFNKVYTVELNFVVRQDQYSGILKNATLIRNQLNKKKYNQFTFNLSGFADIENLSERSNIFEAVESAYDISGIDQTVFIVRSNRRANLFNEQIRKSILNLQNDISSGDRLMVIKNNYFWLSPASKPSFIANGDIIQIIKIKSKKEIYGFSFAVAHVFLVDYPEEPSFDTVLLLDTLQIETASLSYEDSNRLYKNVMEDYIDEVSKFKRLIKVKKNKFFNALQVKYAYSITCHKSQGGQWENVFVEKPYLPNGSNKEYLRWLYTAVTRSTKKLYLIGFTSEDFNLKS